MQQFLFIILTILLISTFVSAQTKSNEQISAQMKSLNVGKQILLEYDKSSNYSKLLLLSGEFKGAQAKRNGLSSLTLGMMYGFNGKELTFTPDIFILTFWATGNKPQFAELHDWKAVVDGEIIDLGEARYARKNGDNREFLNFAVTRENLEKISQGKEVTFTLGNAEFSFSPEQLRMFANLLILSNTSMS